MDLSRAEKILKDLQTGSQKVAKVSTAVDYLAETSQRLAELSGEFKKASKLLSTSQQDAKKAQTAVLSEIEPAITTLHSSHQLLQTLTKQLDEEIKALGGELSENIENAQQPLINEIITLNKDITAQIHRDAGATQSTLSSQTQSLSQINTALAQLISLQEAQQKQLSNHRLWHFISMILLIIIVIKAFL